MLVEEVIYYIIITNNNKKIITTISNKSKIRCAQFFLLVADKDRNNKGRISTHDMHVAYTDNS